MLINICDKRINVITAPCSKNGKRYIGAITPCINLYVKVTNKCNANCSFCEFRGADSKRFDINQYQTALMEVSKTLKINKVSFTGGEPTLKPELLSDLIAMTRKILGKDVFIVVSTNGSKLENLWNSQNIDSIALSRHHYDDEKNSEIFGTTVVPGRKDIKYSQVKHKIHLSCVLSKKAINSGSEVVKYLKFARYIKIYDVGFVGLMRDVNTYCKDNYVNFNRFHLKTLNVVKTKDYTRGSSCACSNYMFVKNEEVVHFYYRHRKKTVGVETLVFDGQNLKTGFDGEIIF